MVMSYWGGGTVNWIRFNIQMATDLIQFVICYASSYYEVIRSEESLCNL